MPSQVPVTSSVLEVQSEHELTRPSKWRRLTYILPLIVPLVVVLTFVIFYNQFLFCTAENPCSPLTAAEIADGIKNVNQTKVASYVARATWTLINGVHVLACLLAIATSSIVIYYVLSEYHEYKAIRWIIIFLIIAIAADVSLFLALWAADDIHSPAQQLLRATVGQALPSINKYMRFGDALSLTGTLSLAVAACATLWQYDVKDELNERQVVHRVHLLRPVLYVGAATLVIALFRLSATHAWGVSYLPPDGEIGKNLSSLTTGIIATMGTFFTLLIAGIYLPAALILRARVREVAATQPNPEAWMTSNGLTLSVPQFLPRAIALLSPLLAGPIGELLVKATKLLGADS